MAPSLICECQGVRTPEGVFHRISSGCNISAIMQKDTPKCTFTVTSEVPEWPSGVISSDFFIDIHRFSDLRCMRIHILHNVTPGTENHCIYLRDKGLMGVSNA